MPDAGDWSSSAKPMCQVSGPDRCQAQIQAVKAYRKSPVVGGPLVGLLLKVWKHESQHVKGHLLRMCVRKSNCENCYCRAALI